MILAKCDMNEVQGYVGKVVSGDDKVLLNLEVGVSELKDALNVILGNKSVYCVTLDDWNGSDELPKIPEDLVGKVFSKVRSSDIKVAPEGYITYVEYPKGYSDMREVLKACNENENVRVFGGNFLEIPGVRIGRTDKGKEKMLSSYNGVYDAFIEADIKDLDNIEVIKSKFNKRDLEAMSGADVSEKEKKEKSTSGKSSGNKVSKVIGSSFGNLFGSEDVDF